ATEHFWQLHRQRVGITCIDAHGFYEFLQRQTLRLHESQSLGCGLNACCGDHISRNLNSAGLANWSDMQDRLTAGLKNWTAFTQRFISPTNVVNKLAFFSCAFAAGEARFNEPRAPAFDNVRRRTHRIRSDGGMRKDDVTWGELFA